MSKLSVLPIDESISSNSPSEGGLGPLRAVRMEVVGRNVDVASVGRLIVYGPALLLGYVLIVASVTRLLALALGWSAALLVMGALHAALGIQGIRRSRLAVKFRGFDLRPTSALPAAASAYSETDRHTPTGGPWSPGDRVPTYPGHAASSNTPRVWVAPPLPFRGVPRS